MKHLFPSVAIFSAVLAFPALAADISPDKEWIDEAEKGNAWEQTRLGMWNESHHHYEEATQWFRKAAGQENPAAKCHLGVLYENGLGVPKDYVEAAKWYWQAADEGNIPARERLGVLFENGSGVPQDVVRAYMWFHVAASQRDREAAKHAQALEKTLAPGQIAEGQRLAQEWMQQHPEPKVDY